MPVTGAATPSAVLSRRPEHAGPGTEEQEKKAENCIRKAHRNMYLCSANVGPAQGALRLRAAINGVLCASPIIDF